MSSEVEARAYPGWPLLVLDIVLFVAAGWLFYWMARQSSLGTQLPLGYLIPLDILLLMRCT